MENFKGSKNPWILEDVEIFDQDGKLIAGVYGEFNDKLYQYTEVSYANILLISKAPEMLEMLENCFCMLDRIRPATEEEMREMKNNIKKLIKEATEL